MTAVAPERPGFSHAAGPVHLFDAGGRGGVFQHAVAVAESLASSGVQVVMHTATDAEMSAQGVRTCACMRWYRGLPGGVRQAVTAARFVVRTLPHLVRTSRRGVLHVEGSFDVYLTAMMFFFVRVCRVRAVFSPHNTFVRNGGRVAHWFFRFSLRAARQVVVFSDDDVSRLATFGVASRRATLVHRVIHPSPDDVAAWRARYGTGPVALLAGQVRADKRPDVFVYACMRAGVTAAIVGVAHDGEHLAEAAAAAATGPVVRVDGYLDAADFAAAIAAADVVVASHAVGSVSGPLALAADLGARSVAFDIGGLGEQVTVAVDPSLGTQGLADGIIATLMHQVPVPLSHGGTTAVEHMAVYRSAGWQDPAAALSGPAGADDAVAGHDVAGHDGALRVGVVIGSGHDGGAERYLRDLYAGPEGVAAMLLGSLHGWSSTGRPALDVGLGEKWSKATLLQSLRSVRRERAHALAAITAAHRAEPFDVFHLQFKREQVLLTRALSRLAPVVWTEHGVLSDSLLARPLLVAYRRAACSVHRIVCVSEPVARSVRAVGGADVEVTVVPNAVDLERFSRPVSSPPARFERPFTIGVAARLHPAKRLDRAVAAAAAAQAKLVVTGDGPDRARLEQLAHDRGVDASFLGGVKDVAAFYHSVDVVVCCGARTGEGLPLAVLEACAAGCAVIGFAEDDVVAAVVSDAGGVILASPNDLAAVTTSQLADAAARGNAWVQDRGLPTWRTQTFAALSTSVALSGAVPGPVPEEVCR
jgi:glycosyltransferase involved in cell wall biosynthesis